MAIPTPAPRITRFEQLGYGFFLHWGLYSLLGQGEWVQHLRHIPMDEYAPLKDRFTAADFDGHAIARLAREAGMKYITLTSRHHDGFSLYDTRGLSDHDAPHSAAGRDLVAELIEGCRAEDILPLFYHTTLDWYQPSFNDDFNAYLDYLHKSVETLCTQYGPLGGLWFDGNWSKPDADWQEDRLYSMIRRHQPEAMIINNTGLSARGHVGHPEIDSVTFEQGRPEAMDLDGDAKYVAAEMCQTMNRHWGIGSEDFKYMGPPDIIENLCACRKVGANYLLNVGPTASGAIPGYEAAALRRVGEWIADHDQIVYRGRPSSVKGGGADFALELDGKTYLFIHHLSIGGHGHVTVAGGGVGPRSFANVRQAVSTVRWLDNDEQLAFTHNPDSGLFCLDATGYPYGVDRVVRIAELS
ncbi:MAG: alpha-L-fucosidase [Candidatus Latescibacteria bacterium]|nr:alpha-L-fucosidase [Candidatus Latescibacterota bacterium]